MAASSASSSVGNDGSMYLDGRAPKVTSGGLSPSSYPCPNEPPSPKAWKLALKLSYL